MNSTQTWPSRSGMPAGTDAVAPAATVPSMFEASVAADPGQPAVHYFGNSLSRRDLAEQSAGIAARLSRLGVVRGSRVAISLQNTPVFIGALLGVWQLGGSVVPVNPMVRPTELETMLADSGALVLIAHPEMSEVIAEAVSRLDHRLVVLWSESDELAGDMPLPFHKPGAEPAIGEPLATFADDSSADTVPPSAAQPSDIALITYTSGTTGPPKGAMSTHANLAFQALNCRRWFDLNSDDSILTIAPFFHITGLGAHIAPALAGGHPMVLTYRFEPHTVGQLLRRYRPSSTVGAITAFIALLDAGGDTTAALHVLSKIYSGGAPVPENVVNRFEAATGRYIHNIYGLTETTSACIAVPFGRRAPVEPASGALSVGVPMLDTTVLIVDDAGEPVPAGTQGEIVVAGPQVDAGYWHKPAETTATFRENGVHTGDIGVMDDDGWVFVVDRKKDLVVVSGYKVWPRDVEDVLYTHPSVREVAVVGIPDDYRGETLKAYVSLRPGTTADAGELAGWCRERLSAYKVPTEFAFIDDLPKTLTGKILRRSLRES